MAINSCLEDDMAHTSCPFGNATVVLKNLLSKLENISVHKVTKSISKGMSPESFTTLILAYVKYASDSVRS